jgi:hypothetical protein
MLGDSTKVSTSSPLAVKARCKDDGTIDPTLINTETQRQLQRTHSLKPDVIVHILSWWLCCGVEFFRLAFSLEIPTCLWGQPLLPGPALC